MYTEVEKLIVSNKLLTAPSEQLAELEHIHNKVIFDAFNESLDEKRPFGIKGYSLPWKIDC